MALIWATNYAATTQQIARPENGGCIVFFLCSTCPLSTRESFIPNRSKRRKQATPNQRVQEGHWPIPYSKGRCKRCLKNKQIKWCTMACEKCDKIIYLPCFQNHCEADLAWRGNSKLAESERFYLFCHFIQAHVIFFACNFFFFNSAHSSVTIIYSYIQHFTIIYDILTSIYEKMCVTFSYILKFPTCKLILCNFWFPITNNLTAKLSPNISTGTTNFVLNVFPGDL